MVNKKVAESTNYTLLGIILLVIGVVVIIEKSVVLSVLFLVLGISSLWGAVTMFLHMFSQKHEEKITIAQILLKAALGVMFLYYRNIPMSVVTILFSIYMLLYAFTYMINAVIYYKNHQKGFLGQFIRMVFYFVFAFSLMFSPLMSLDTLMIIMGSYCILLALTYFSDALEEGVSDETKNRYKRKVRISLPVALAALLPKITLVKINQCLEEDEDYEFESKKEDVVPDMMIYIHAVDSGFGAVGHVDLSFEGEVISYGNYDNSSAKLFDAIGDGVFFTSPIEPYLPFCIHHEKNNIFEFGLKLSDEEKEDVRKQIKEIKSETYQWDPEVVQKNDQAHPELYQDFSSQLYLSTGATLYKFNKGKFKTYFVLGTNCVLLADSVIGRLGTDILNIRGIVSPGVYLNYLQKEYLRKGSRVIYSKTYLYKE